MQGVRLSRRYTSGMGVDLRAAAGEYRYWRRGYEQARAELHRQIRRKLARGLPPAEIARQTGLTPQRVHQIGLSA